VRASYLEIYNENIRDLLSEDPEATRELKEHPDKGVFVKDLNAFMVSSVKEIDLLMKKGSTNRKVAATLMNKQVCFLIVYNSPPCSLLGLTPSLPSRSKLQRWDWMEKSLFGLENSILWIWQEVSASPKQEQRYSPMLLEGY
jgi:hypothetical protein